MPQSRAPLMESSDNNATPTSSAADSRRRSGRVVKAPRKYSPEASQATASKRKRDHENDDEDGENEDPDQPDAEDATGDDMDEDQSADEDPERTPRKSKAKPKKPAAKRAKVNGNAPPAGTSNDAPAPALRLASRPKKNVRVAIARRDGDGLYGRIYCSHNKHRKTDANPLRSRDIRVWRLLR